MNYVHLCNQFSNVVWIILKCYVRSVLLIKKYTIQVKEKFLLNQIIIINGVYSYIDFNFKLHSSVKSCSYAEIEPVPQSLSKLTQENNLIV